MKVINKAISMVSKFFYDLFHFGFKIAHYNFWGEFSGFDIIKGKLGERIDNKKHELIYKFLEKKYKELINEYKEKNIINTNASKTIWCCWWQGLDTAPIIVKKCIQSIKDNSGDYEVVIITKDNLNNYIDIPKNILEKVEKKKITFTHFSDIIRLGLLNKYGGIWVDATMYFCDNTFKYFDDVNFNSVKTIKEVEKDWTGFFIGGKPNKLFAFCYDMLIKYNTEYNKLINYFLIDLSIEMAYQNFEECNSYIKNISIINPNIFKLQSILNDKYDEKQLNELFVNDKFFKLSFKRPLKEKTNDGKLTNYGYLISK